MKRGHHRGSHSEHHSHRGEHFKHSKHGKDHSGSDSDSSDDSNNGSHREARCHRGEHFKHSKHGKDHSGSDSSDDSNNGSHREAPCHRGRHSHRGWHTSHHRDVSEKDLKSGTRNIMIRGELNAGQALYFEGFVPAEAKEFEINFKTGQSKDDDTAFHFKLFPGRRLALNSCRKGSWGREETDEPFAKGAAFILIFVITAEGYEIYINGSRRCMFKHRIPSNKVSGIEIGGDVTISRFKRIESWSSSSFFKEYSMTTHSKISFPVSNPQIPYAGAMSGVLRPGMAVYFQGTIPQEATEFEINFKTGQYQNDDTAFHFKPFLGKRVVMNSYKNGSWEKEESASDKPFVKRAHFIIFFVIKAEGYEVYINGSRHCMFKHRIPLEKVSALLISGNVSMTTLDLIENWQTSSIFLNNFQSELVEPILKPVIPHVSPLSRGLRPGMALCFQGIVPVNAKRFVINLQTGPLVTDDKAFHFSPRIGEKVVMNSVQNNIWGSEESAPVKSFTRGGAFTMFFLVKPQCYEVYVNGFRQCVFKHRIPFEKVSTVSMEGDVSFSILGILENWHNSSFFLSNFQSEMIQPVLKPVIPYVSQLSGGLKPGMALCLQGVVPVDAKEFAISLQTGSSDANDKAFYFKPCIGEKVALNSFQNASWEREESAPIKPFNSGAAFKMFLVVKPQCYEVYVNGFRHCMFKHRIPLEKVSALLVNGNVFLNIFGIIENWHTSSFFLNNLKSEMVQPVLKPEIPYMSPISGGLKPGMALCFQGVVPVDAKEFYINLQTGPSDDDDKAIHFKPCIGRKVALNSFQDRSWQKEESAPSKPFTSGAAFKMFLVVRPECYEVYVNGVQLCTFRHRVHLEKVSTLAINGDVTMNILGVIENWNTSSFFLHSFLSEMAQPVIKPAIPYMSPLSAKLKLGMALSFHGVVPVDAKEFEINLQTGLSDGDDKAFCFKTSIGNKVAMNSFQNGKWENEVSAPAKPFTSGAAFNMVFVVKPQCYEVYVNEVRHCLFHHRIPWEKVSALVIGGDVSMNLLGVINNWPTSSFFVNTFLSGMAKPVFRPTIPYADTLYERTRLGTALCLQGVVPEEAKEFAINLKTGPADGDDIAFQFRPLIGQKVILNSRRNGKWDSEESASDKPFTKGESFNMITVISAEGFRVFVNGVKHSILNHRVPVQRAACLEICGDVSLNVLGYVDKWISSSFYKEQQRMLAVKGSPQSLGQLQVSHPVSDPAIPYSGTIPKVAKQDMAVYFQGTVPEQADQFAINFKTGPADGDDIAFSFNPLIDQKVILNSFRNGKWDSEESVSDCPFTKGAPFSMFVALGPVGYQVFVNDVKHSTFKHRLPVEKVSNLGVSGDVAMNVLGYIDKWSTTSFYTEQQKIPDVESSSCTTVKLQVSHPVSNPAIPYSGKIPEEVKQDMAVYFQGTVPENADQFAINFKTGPADGDDIAFSFNPLIGQKVILNSFRNGKWDSEESVSDCPFTKGAPFNMFVAPSAVGYEVYVNGMKHSTFKHRLPVEKVSNLRVSGDVAMNVLGYIDKWSTTSFYTEQQKIPGGESSSCTSVKLQVSHPVSNPAIPYSGKIPEEVKQDMAVYFQGTVPENADQFAINFKTGPADGDDIAFSFNPLIGQKVILNSFRNGKWDSEESVSDCPFTKGAPFNMFVAPSAVGYEVYVNGIKHSTFKHRLPVEKVSNLGVSGDVAMNVLGYIDKWSTTSFYTEQQKIPDEESSSHTTVKLQVSHPVSNPAIPYSGKIPKEVKQDMAVYFQGTVPENADQFAINFKTGPADGDDIAFSFNPLIDQKVILNSFRNGKWDSEESVSDCPFIKGAPFNMFVAPSAVGYEVYVNGMNHSTFKHRLPVEKVSNLGVSGDVAMNVLGYIDKWSTTSFYTEQQKIPDEESSSCTTVKLQVSHPVSNPAIPYSGKIPKEVKQDMAVYFQGTVPENADQFAINFKTGPADGDDIAFSFNPLIGQKVILNSFRNGKWDSEESVSDCPFIKGAPFNMFVAPSAVGYEVYVNSMKHSTFKHRLPVEKVSNLGISGDVAMNVLGYIDKWSTTSFYTEQQKIPDGESSSCTTVKLQVSHPVSNPAIPYSGKIPKEVKQDMAVYFQGTVPENADQFAINFKTGPADGDDIAFSFNPLIGQKVILNSFRNGKWDSEESVSDCPFIKGAPFNMFVAPSAVGYEVYVNGMKHSTFKHRLPVEKVSNLGVSGDVAMNVLGYIDKWSTTSFYTEQQKIPDVESSSCATVKLQVSHPVSNPAIPYSGKIPKEVKQDMAVYFQGTVPENADQFAINFKTGPADGDDIAFSFNPLIGQKVSLNSFRNGKWDSEESVSDCPFTKGAPFNMFVAPSAVGYEVYVNGMKHSTFKHRLPVEKVSNLGISGDVAMNVLGYIDKWSTTSFYTEQQKIPDVESSSCTTVKLQVSHPVSNPAIPYSGKIPKEVKQDMAVYFQGTVPENADQFAINFKTGPADGDDIAFSFNPLIDQKVILNSFSNGKWDSEESVSDCPFTKGAPFNMFVAPSAVGYEVYVNGMKHSTFKHRLPVEKVSNLGVSGDVAMNVLGYIDKWSTTSFYTEQQKIPDEESSSCTTVKLQVPHPVSNPAIPYSGKIPEEVKQDMAVYFQGTVPQNADQFAINFKTGPADGDDIAFSFNPLIGQKVILNSFRNGKWDSEESVSDCPFTKGAPFNMFVAPSAVGYEVYVNGMKHSTFKHRLPVEKVSNLGISGDVAMNVLGYIDKWSTTSFYTEQQKIPDGESSSCTTVKLQVSHPVSNPTIPYSGTIPEEVKQDMAVYFQGTVPENADQFAINFKTGPADGDDIAFSFNPVIGQKVILNSFRNGKWDSEESVSDCPFTKGAPFNMFVAPSAVGYEVYVNGVKHSTFKHRLPVDKVSNLGIGGDVSMDMLGYIDKWSSSSNFKEQQNVSGIGGSFWSLSPVQLEVSHPVSNPEIPYVGAIPEGIKSDMAVCFQGTVPENADQFSINFKAGPADGDDIAFNFNPRIGENVFLNSFSNGKWGSGESVSYNPFTKGAPFNIFVVISAVGYEVYVNGVKHSTFKHRLPVEKFSNLGIGGDVSMNMLGYIDKWSSSSCFKEQQKTSGIGGSFWSLSPVQLEVSHPVSNPEIPYVGAIPEGIKSDMAVCFQGTVPEDADQFSVNFKAGPADGDDIAFNFNPRIGEKVILNSFSNGKWGSGESVSYNPFTKGAPFNMFVVISAVGYEIYVNGVKHSTFKHRLPVEKFSNLGIGGDVSMNMLGYIDKWSSSSCFKEQQKTSGIGGSFWSLSPVQLEVSHPVSNPEIPYVGAIPEGTKSDMAVCFQGTVPENADQFSINFKAGPADGDDIAFHFNPRIGEKVFLNSFSNGKWGSGESVSYNPFSKGAPFNMFVVISAVGYEVYVNGVKHSTFKHRLPVEKFSNLGIGGDVSMNMLGYIDKWSSSSCFKEQQKTSGIGGSFWSLCPVQLEVSHPVSNPAIPYVGAIPEGTKSDMAVCFQGTVPEKADQFSINFKAGPADGDDIAFHFNPRIGEKVFLNSFSNGKWGSGESVSYNPFSKGAPFNMFVVISAVGYEVYVNGVKHSTFKHRLPVEKFSNLGIGGDVSMNMLGYIDKWSSSSCFKEQQKTSGIGGSFWSLCPVQLEVSHPVSNPEIPYVGAIPEGIKSDMAVCFQGTVPENADQFSINFKAGPADGDDIAFNFNPRIGEKVFLNSFSNGKWGSGESVAYNPFTKGAPFNIFVVVSAVGYEVYVNGVKHSTFKHRLPVEKFSNLGIGGDVSMNMLGYIDKWSSSSCFKEQQKTSGIGGSFWSLSPVQLEVSHPVSNPAIPYVGAIPEGTKSDMAVCFQGTVPENADQFSIDFKAGPADGDDIAFHFNPRIGEKVILNSFSNGKWGSGESVSYNPFTKGAPFNMFVVISAVGYEVYVNGVKHSTFKHRLPVEKFSNLGIGGDVSMNMLGYIDKWRSSSCFKEQQKTSGIGGSFWSLSPVQLEVSHPVSNPAIPYVGAIPEGTKSDMAVCFQGTVPENADQFSINFKAGPADGDDIAFHFNPRIGEKVFLNSFSNGKWGSGESVSYNPFTKGAPFNMFVVISAVGYEVYVNGVKHSTFKHRLPVEKFSNLGIGGDVSMNMLGYIDKWRSSSCFKEQQKTSGIGGSFWSLSPVQLEVSHPVSNPAIPYVGAIPEGIKSDMAVCFQGTVPENADQFSINFKAGPADGDDIAFHFNPRIGEKVFLNSFSNGKWGSGESVSYNPFTKGAPFNMFVVISAVGYEVYVNGVKHSTFKHRLPVEKFSNLGIGGDVSMNMLGYIDKWRSSSCFKEQQKTSGIGGSFWSLSPVQLEVSHPVSNPAIPYVGAIPEGTKSDMAVCFQGTVPENADQFSINFKAGPADGDDIAFHFNPRIGEKVFLNSFSNGKWGSGESVSYNPFTKGAPFNMFVVISAVGYEVYVNGVKHSTFKHRLPVEKFSNLGIGGDVSMNMLGYIDKWRSSSCFKEQQKTSGIGGSFWSLSPVQLEVSHPVSNPAIPYVGAIPEGIKSDMAVCFQGTVPENADQFSINFKAGPADGDDIAFNFNPRIGEKVILNSFSNGKWGSGESVSYNPFTKGAPFNMFVVISAVGYEVYVNGVKHSTFKHRLPVEKFSNLGIGGDVSMNMLGYIDKWRSSSCFKEQQKTSGIGGSFWSLSPVQLEVSHPVSNPAIPYVGAIPEGTKSDMAVCFQGTVPENADQFSINFKAGPADGDDIAFHFNPRIGEKVFLNSFSNGKWGSGESVSYNPFSKGAPFNMFVVISAVGYEVYVNGVKHSTFKHRLPVEKFSNLGIGGDVSMNMLGYIDKWRSSSCFKEQQKTSGIGGSFWSLSPVQLEVSHPVSNPAIPYVGAIPEGIKSDMAVCFQGTVPENADQFSINFKAGPADGDDIAFNFNPRIGEKVILNSFSNGKWGSGESVAYNPFTKGAPFNMFVVISAVGYEVYVNGVKHSTFKHRLPVEKFSNLGIGGDVSMNMLGYINKWRSSSCFKEQQKTSGIGGSFWSLSPVQLEVSHPVSNPAIPYVGAIPEGTKSDMAVFFQGTVPEKADQFSINFKAGPADGDDIAFNFNPRIGEKVFLNSFSNGKWGSGESVSYNPFTKGAPFNMFVVISAVGYEVYVNGVRHSTFKHRLPVEKFSNLGIGGDVSMNMLGYIDKWRSSSCFKEQQKTSGIGGSFWSLSPVQLEVSHPVSNPAIPYVGAIPEGTKSDMAVFFQGTVPEKADQFSINFKAGPADGDDIAFNFNPRIGEKVFLNSFSNGKWGSGESVSYNPFTKGAPFNMFVVISAVGYEVYVNGVRHSTFKHRLPVEKFSNLGIGGDVSMNMLGYIDKWSSSSCFKEQQKTSGIGGSFWSLSPVQLEVSHPVSNPAIPYVGAIPQGTKSDMAVFFQGTVPENADQFSVNFKAGPADGDDIAFNFNPRIGEKVILNSFSNGKWGSGESVSYNPFTKGAPFNMFVVISAVGYEVYVNGVKHSMFKHRLPVEKFSNLGIAGNVSMNLLGYFDKWSSSSFYVEQQKISAQTSSSCSSIQTEMPHQVSNPAIPYVGMIPEGLKQDMAVFFQVTIPGNAVLFTINFKCGPSHKDDIAFHFNPRCGQKVAMNSLKHGNWEREEVASHKPFSRGATLSMYVVIGAEGFEVYVNGVKHSTFKHRLPVEKVSHIEILANVSISTVAYIYNWSSSSFFEKLHNISSKGSSSCVQLEVSHPVSNPAIPYTGTIPEVIKPNMAICFQGIVPAQAKEFAINLKTGPSDKDDVAFCLNPCIGKKVALNSFRNGKWEKEESVSDKPFTPGTPFALFVVFKPDGYEVNLNGTELCKFKHRIPMDKVSVLNIHGDVSITMLGFIKNWSK